MHTFELQDSRQTLAHALAEYHALNPGLAKGRTMPPAAQNFFRCHDALRHWAQPVTMISRLRLDVTLYDPAPERTPSQTGRPRLKDERWPTLQQVLWEATTAWTTVMVTGWYREPQRTIEVVSATAMWYHTGLPPMTIRWVLSRDP